MKKVYRLKDLDCANCAAKMERAISKIDGVSEANVSFMSQKLTLDLDENRIDSIMDEIVHVCKRIEPDCVIVR